MANIHILDLFTSIHAHCCFQSTQDPPLWMSLTTCSSPNYLGWFPPDPTSLTPLPESISICVFFSPFFFFSFLLFFLFSSSHISPGHRVLKIYERYSGSSWPHQSFPVKYCEGTAHMSLDSRCHVHAWMLMLRDTCSHTSAYINTLIFQYRDVIPKVNPPVL